MNFNPITDGLLKAIRLLSEEPSQKASAAKPKFRIEFDGDQKYKSRIDNSRYTGERLREVRAAGGGAKEQARAERRRANKP